MSDNVANTAIDRLFASLDEGQKHERLLSFVHYPKTQQLATKEPPPITCHYTCAGTICDFKEALKCVDQSVDLRAYGCQKLVSDVESLSNPKLRLSIFLNYDTFSLLATSISTQKITWLRILTGFSCIGAASMYLLSSAWTTKATN
jgi:hypothetical protein